MSNSAECSECRAILEELKQAAAGRVISPERKEELRGYSDGLRKMRAGSKDSTEELLAGFPFRSQPPEQLRLPEHVPIDPRTSAVLRRVLELQSRSGHSIADLFRK